MMKKCLFAQHVSHTQAIVLNHLILKHYGGHVKPYFVAATLPPDIKYDGYVEKVTDYLAERLELYSDGVIEALNLALTERYQNAEFRDMP